MGKTVTALLIFAFFAILAVNTAFHPFAAWKIQSGPLLILDGIVQTALVSWLGSTLSALLLAILAVAIPLLALAEDRKRDRPAPTPQPTRPAPDRLGKQARPTFGKR